jgi:DNA-binding protein WhiA
LSFSREVRNQLCLLPVEKPCCRQTQLLALTIVSATEAHTIDSRPHLLFTLDNAAVVRHIFKLGKAVFGLAPVVDLGLSRAHPTGRHGAFQVALPVAESSMVESRLTLEEIQTAIAKKHCCKRAFLRGAFLGCGSLVTPSKAYHLEFNAPEAPSAWIAEVLSQEGIEPKCYQRAAHSELFTVYVKDSADISHFLTLIGAHQALIELEEVRVGKDLVNTVQRAVNCETANLSRTLQSAKRQVQEAAWLQAHGHLKRLDHECRRVAEARLASPYASLQELGEGLVPPLSKSAVNHRLRLIHQDYETHGGPSGSI